MRKEYHEAVQKLATDKEVDKYRLFGQPLLEYSRKEIAKAFVYFYGWMGIEGTIDSKRKEEKEVLENKQLERIERMQKWLVMAHYRMRKKQWFKRMKKEGLMPDVSDIFKEE